MSRPTTTGGRPLSALSSTISVRRPGKRLTASSAPSGSPSAVAISTAERLTSRLSATMCHSSRSSSSTRRSPSAIAGIYARVARVGGNKQKCAGALTWPIRWFERRPHGDLLQARAPAAISEHRRGQSEAGGAVLRLVRRGVQARRALGAGEGAHRARGGAGGAMPLLHRRLLEG